MFDSNPEGEKHAGYVETSLKAVTKPAGTVNTPAGLASFLSLGAPCSFLFLLLLFGARVA